MVRRYDLEWEDTGCECNCVCGAFLDENLDGDYVTYDDYQKLKASHAELVEALAEVKEYIGHLKMGSKHQEMRESLHLSAIYTIAQAALNKAREMME